MNKQKLEDIKHLSSHVIAKLNYEYAYDFIASNADSIGFSVYNIEHEDSLIRSFYVVSQELAIHLVLKGEVVLNANNIYIWACIKDTTTTKKTVKEFLKSR